MLDSFSELNSMAKQWASTMKQKIVQAWNREEFFFFDRLRFHAMLFYRCICSFSGSEIAQGFLNDSGWIKDTSKYVLIKYFRVFILWIEFSQCFCTMLKVCKQIHKRIKYYSYSKKKKIFELWRLLERFGYWNLEARPTMLKMNEIHIIKSTNFLVIAIALTRKNGVSEKVTQNIKSGNMALT